MSVTRLCPSVAHRVYVVIGLAWPVFGIFFISLLCGTSWFSLNLVQLFPLFSFVSLAIGYVLAMLLESKATTRLFAFFKHGMPLLYFRHFAFVEEEQAIKFGLRRLLLSAVDELYLTWLGTLEIRSYALSGKFESKGGGAFEDGRAEIVAKVPLSVLDLTGQKELIELLSSKNPQVLKNKRLDERLKSPIVKGQMLIQLFGACVITFALFDVGYATCDWLTILRDYYGAQLLLARPDSEEAKAFRAAAPLPTVSGGDRAIAEKLYERAEAVRSNPSPISWAYPALFRNANSASQIALIRSETLFLLGKREEAVKIMREAITKSPSGFKNQIVLARFLYEMGESKEASKLLSLVIEKHKDVLLPRIYNLALIDAKDGAARAKLFSDYLSELDEEVFGTEPAWPPGGEKPIMEMWRRDDLTFLASALVAIEKRDKAAQK